MTTVKNESRRNFLKAGATIGGGFVLGFYLPSGGRQAFAAGATHMPNAWIKIAEDNQVTILCSRSEMGQGVYTSMPALVAEELEVDMAALKVEAAPEGAVYINQIFGAQLTGGSTSIRDSFTYLRQAGASARMMLVSAAAQAWGAKDKDCVAEGGMITHVPSGKQVTYGQVAAKASKLPVPKEPKLKHPDEWKLVGKWLPRTDTAVKVNGSAQFGIDVKVPNMLTAAVSMCPVIGGKVVKFDDAAAKKMTGVKSVLKFNDTYTEGVAVLADTFFNAKAALAKVKVTWDEGKNKSLNSDVISKILRDKAKAGGGAVARESGDVDSAINSAGTKVKAWYEHQFLCHSPMEPMNTTADVRKDGADIYSPIQFQTIVPPTVAQVTGLKPESVRVHTTFLGGGFGRRVEWDYMTQATILSKMAGQPVKVLWTREDDMTNDSYRPVSYQEVSTGLDGQGLPVAWDFKLSSPSISSRLFPGAVQNGIDPFMLEAAENMPYTIPNVRLTSIMTDTGQRVGYWRSVSNALNAFAQESFIDEMAHAAGRDPVEYRMALLEGKPRYQRVLELAARKAGWGKPMPAGRALGVALVECYETYFCLVADVSVNKAGELKLNRFVSAVDCGHVVNSNIADQQMESGLVTGMQSIWLEITIKEGRVQQRNFDTYPLPRLVQMPKFETYFVASNEKPGGLGEVGTPLVAPAVANAIFAITGKRVRKLPIKQSDLKA